MYLISCSVNQAVYLITLPLGSVSTSTLYVIPNSERLDLLHCKSNAFNKCTFFTCNIQWIAANDESSYRYIFNIMDKHPLTLCLKFLSRDTYHSNHELYWPRYVQKPRADPCKVSCRVTTLRIISRKLQNPICLSRLFRSC